MGRALGSNGLIAMDESTTIKNHKAKRTKNLMKIASNFKYKRLLTGSPVTKSPMDIYSQCEFLREGLLGYDSFYAFQGRYAVTQKRTMGHNSFQQIIGFKNLDELTWRIKTFPIECSKKTASISPIKSIPLDTSP